MAIATIAAPKCLSFFLTNTKNKSPPPSRPPIPLFISTDASAVDLCRLSSLYCSCNHSLHRFPTNPPQPDLRKLGVAIAHSSLVVSVFAKAEDAGMDGDRSFGPRWAPLSPENGQLVGFGRAVSDLGLTASIYDVMVLPDVRRMGIGRMIVQRIVRTLTNRGVYDISALCSDQESLFFKACGFGDDMLGATTMIYTQTDSRDSDNSLTAMAGRRILVDPPPRVPFDELNNSVNS